MDGFLGAAFRSFAGRIIGAASALAAAHAVTSTLTLNDSGLFFLSLGFAIFFSHLLRFGLDIFALKKCAIYLNDRNYKDFLSIVLACCLAVIAGSALIYFVLYASGFVVNYKYMYYLLLIFPAGLAVALTGVIAHSLHAAGYVFTGSVTNLSAHFIIFTVLVWILSPSDVNSVISLFTTACFVALFIQIIAALYVYSINGFTIEDTKKVQLAQVDFREIYQTTLPLWMVVIAQQLNQLGAQFISSLYIDETEIAFLAVATRIALIVPMVLTAVNMVVSPKFAALHHSGDTQKTEEVLTKSLKLLAVVSSGIFLVIVFFGSNVLEIFGTQYTQAAGILTILVCGQLVNALTGPSGKLLMMSGYEKDFRNSSVVVTAIGLLLALVLVAQYGVYGAAVATALTIATQNIAVAYLVKQRMGINLLRLYANFF
jgi:O-antigen/teichoic acid export membrane protein